MKIDVLLGLQWGDEGKGKVVDVLTPNYDIIARFQGGPNAGHTLEFNNIKHVLHNIPSGIFRDHTINIIGNGVVLDPIIFHKEITAIDKMQVKLDNTLLISKKAHLIMPSHRILDKASEADKGKEKIGSTLKGIGPTYMDKTGRNGIRVGDILEPDFKERCHKLLKKHEQLLKLYDFTYDYKEFEAGWWEGIECIKRFTLVDSEFYLNQSISENKSVLAEGAQGTLLDIDFGSYPYVTSSNTICAGACTGLGVAPNKIADVYGIFKAYCTRVGSGPFPTELENEIGQHLRDKGAEYGATTGRPRRCGWLDLVALNYSIMLNGVTQLIMTKGDVLSEMDTIKVCTQYKTNEGITKDFPYSIEKSIEPVYQEFKGWKTDISNIRNYNNLPRETKEYIQFIEKETGVPIKHISVGPGREDIISR